MKNTCNFPRFPVDNAGFLIYFFIKETGKEPIYLKGGKGGLNPALLDSEDWGFATIKFPPI